MSNQCNQQSLMHANANANASMLMPGSGKREGQGKISDLAVDLKSSINLR